MAKNTAKNSKIAKQEEKEKRIKAEIKKLKALLKDLPKCKIAAAVGLIENCAYLKVSLDELREAINKKGFTDKMKQGSYTIIRENPQVKTYTSLIQKYSVVSKQLFDLLPADNEGGGGGGGNDGFDNFVNSRKS